MCRWPDEKPLSERTSKAVIKNMKTRNEFMDQQLRIINNKTKEEILLTPHAVESCMNPGTFHITPLSVTETDDMLTITNTVQTINIRKKALSTMEVSITKEPFTPEIIRKKNSCNPCTNCGQCSW